MLEAMNITRTIYKVSDFLSWQRNGQLDLRPPFQRGSVWSQRAKSYFLDTLLRGFAVPIIFLQDETDPKTYELRRLVVDGQQRLRTVLAYVDRSALNDAEEGDDFAILATHNKEYAGMRFARLPVEARQRILGFEFSVHVLPSTTSSQLLLETFARMNSTGVKVNYQELRNATFFGAFKGMVYSLSYEQLERWLRWGVFSRSSIARMREAELTSELLMLLQYGIDGKSQAHIDDTYDVWEDRVPYAAERIRRFRLIFEKLDELHRDNLNVLFGEEFAESTFRTQGWFYVLFVLVNGLMFGKATLGQRARPATVRARALREHLAERAERLQSEMVATDVLKALRGASTDKSSRVARYNFMREGLRSGR